MAKIVPKFITNSNDRIVIVDDMNRVWVFNDKINPSRWVWVTILPDLPKPDEKPSDA